MARSFDGIDDNISCGIVTGLAGATNASFSAWIYRPATNTTVGFGQITSPYRVSCIWFSDSNIYIAFENGLDVFPNFLKSETGWHNIVAVYNGALPDLSKIMVYWDGVAQTLSYGSSAFAPSSLATAGNQPIWDFGRDFVSSAFRYWAGQIAHAGVWDVSLTADEAISLSQGYTPNQIRSNNLLSYWELAGRSDPEPDLYGENSSTSITGTAYAENPKILYPAKSRSIHISTAAAAPTTHEGNIFSSLVINGIGRGGLSLPLSLTKNLILSGFTRSSLSASSRSRSSISLNDRVSGGAVYSARETNNLVINSNVFPFAKFAARDAGNLLVTAGASAGSALGGKITSQLLVDKFVLASVKSSAYSSQNILVINGTVGGNVLGQAEIFLGELTGSLVIAGLARNSVLVSGNLGTQLRLISLSEVPSLRKFGLSTRDLTINPSVTGLFRPGGFASRVLVITGTATGDEIEFSPSELISAAMTGSLRINGAEHPVLILPVVTSRNLVITGGNFGHVKFDGKLRTDLSLIAEASVSVEVAEVIDVVKFVYFVTTKIGETNSFVLYIPEVE